MYLSPRLTRVPRGLWSTGSSGFGCQASVVYSPAILSSGSLQTCCLCGRWLAASCTTRNKDFIKDKDAEGPLRGEEAFWMKQYYLCWDEVGEILTSCCCRQHLRTLGCQLLWAAAGRRLPLLKLWTAPPDTGVRMKSRLCFSTFAVNCASETKTFYLATQHTFKKLKHIMEGGV